MKSFDKKKYCFQPITSFGFDNYRDHVKNVNNLSFLCILCFHLKKQSAKTICTHIKTKHFEIKYEVKNYTKEAYLGIELVYTATKNMP